MVVHIVAWKLKDEYLREKKTEIMQKIKESLESLKDKINEIKKIEVGINVNTTESAYDIILYSEFGSLDDLDIYQVHPEHLKVSGFVKSVVASRVVADYEK